MSSAKLYEYLESLKEEAKNDRASSFYVEVIDAAWETWGKLDRLFCAIGKSLEVPDACPGEQDNFMFTWSKGEHYLECEIFGNGSLEFFYRNRLTGDVWGEDSLIEKDIPESAVKKLDLFCRKSIFIDKSTEDGSFAFLLSTKQELYLKAMAFNIGFDFAIEKKRVLSRLISMRRSTMKKYGHIPKLWTVVDIG